MFGFQTAHKQIQIGRRIASPQRSGRLICSLPAERAERARPASPAATGRLPRQLREPRTTNWIKSRRPRRKISAQPPSANANEAFLVNGSFSNGLQTGQDDFGLRGPVFGIQTPGGLAGSGRRRPAWRRPRRSRRSRRWRWSRGRWRIRWWTVEVVADSAEDVAVAGSAGREVSAAPAGRQWRIHWQSRESRPPGHPRQCVVPMAGRRHRRQAFLLERPARAPAEFQQLPLERGARRTAAHSAFAERRFHVLHAELFSARAARAYPTTWARVPTARRTQRKFFADLRQWRGSRPFTIQPHGAPFPGNVIPSSLFNPAAAGLLQYIPLPNLPGTVQNFEFVTAVPADTDNVSFVLNQNLGKNDRLALN